MYVYGETLGGMTCDMGCDMRCDMRWDVGKVDSQWYYSYFSGQCVFVGIYIQLFTTFLTESISNKDINDNMIKYASANSIYTCIQCTLYNVLYTMYFIQCTLYNVLYTMYFIQCNL